MALSKKSTIELKSEDKKVLAGLALAAADGRNNVLQDYMADAAGDFGIEPDANAIAKSLNGAEIPTPKITDFLATPSAQVLIPKIILGAMRETTEPLYIATKFMEKIRMKAGQSMIFPSIGTIPRAYDVAEGQEIPEETMDWQTHESNEIRIGKVGLRLRVSDEMISDSQWDIISMMMKAAGRALVRHKENKCFKAWTRHGHTVYDNMLVDPEAHTSGLDAAGVPNNTLAVEDLLNLIIAVMANEMNPTDLILHPLSWIAFARGELTGALDINNQMRGVYSAGKQPNSSFKLGPTSIQGRIPFSFNVSLSPFVPLDKENKLFDMYCIDKDNVGILLVKDDLKVEKFDEPARDIQNIKFVERYGVGVINEGRGIAVARNISLDKSFPEPMAVNVI